MPRKKKSEIKIPKARLLPSGIWFIQLRLNKQSISVKAETEAKCKAKALAIKAGYINAPAKVEAAPTLGEVIDKYIAAHPKLSPNTLKNYKTAKKYRFKAYMDKPIDSIDWSKMINDELATGKSVKTVKNGWYVALPAIEAELGKPIKVKFPKANDLRVDVDAAELAEEQQEKIKFLDYEQIPVFLKQIKNTPIELAALLGLMSLRKSEILALTNKHIDLQHNQIIVAGARYIDENNVRKIKAANKNATSARVVPILIPRLAELLKTSEFADGEFIAEMDETVMYKRVNAACRKAGLPEVGVHGLRHTFASLCYHLDLPVEITMKLGGWKNRTVVEYIYTHLANKDLENSAKKIADFYSEQNANKNANSKK